MKYQFFLSYLILSIGIIGGACFISNNIKSNSELIEVKGLSEKIVKSDIGEITIRISNKNKNIEELYEKIVSDKKKILNFLKENGALDSEIISGSLNVYETENYNLDPKDRKKYFETNDSIQVFSKDIEKVLKIKSKLIDLMHQKVLISYTYSFKLTNFSEIKMDMMKEASEKAKESAEAFIAPHGKKVGNVAYLRQGEITIKAANEENESNSYGNNDTSINKKLRLVVRAGFYKKD